MYGCQLARLPGSNAWQHVSNGDAGDMCNAGKTHHRGTWEIGQATAEGEKEITRNYKSKAEIIGPASCSMAIKLETLKRARKVEGKAHRQAGDIKRHRKQQAQPGTLAVGLQFKERILYGGQGEHSNC
jgi:hypothetical protein